MATAGGRRFYPLDPREDEVHIEDIAHHLSMICRYNGATKKFYSVAEHSIYCSYYGDTLGDPESLERLMHDAAEAYTGDMIRPLKKSGAFGDSFEEIEHRIERVIARRFQLAFPWPTSVRVADEAITTSEVRQVLVSKDGGAGSMFNDTNDAGITIRYWDPDTARLNFLKRFYDLEAVRESAP